MSRARRYRSLCDVARRGLTSARKRRSSTQSKRRAASAIRTSQVLPIENLVVRHTGVRANCAQIKRLTADQAAALDLSPDVALARKPNLAIYETLRQQIAILEKGLTECVKLRAEYYLLKTVLGTGETLAMVIMLGTETVALFAKVGQFSSYYRCVDSVRQSDGRKKGEGDTRNGNARRRGVYYERKQRATTDRCAQGGGGPI